MKLKETTTYKILIAAVIAVSTIALFGGIMEPDSSLYASIAKNMVLRNDWGNLYVRGLNWLDKPHLTFWIAAAFFKLFGITAFAYKLASFLFGLIGAWYTYKLAKSIYDEKVGLLGALLFLSGLHVLVSTFDVRAEIYITTFTLASIYHYYKAQHSSIRHIVIGSFFAACAIMIKGIFVLVTILGGIILYWLFTKQWKQFLKPKWWLAFLLIFIFILPELYTLYVQFDLHPERMIFGKTNVSGIKFFFWDSQFGRFFNNGPIKGKGDLTFFLHTTLWAFLPWSVLFYAAIANLFKRSNRAKHPNESIIIWASAAVTFLMFSLSKFQLPHYILIILPQFAIVTALYIRNLNASQIKIFTIIQNITFFLVAALLTAVAIYFNFEAKYIAIAFIWLVLGAAFYLFKGVILETMIARSAMISVALMIFLSGFFYPAALKYESGMQAGIWLKDHYPQSKAAVLMHGEAFSFDFYAQGEPSYFWSHDELEKFALPKNTILYAPEAEVEYLKQKYNGTVLKSFEYFHLTKLTPKFLNVKTRNEVLERYYLVKIN
ncbi:ArnT family glycosyltransferase [Pedobacter sp. AW1-32]|uniref:ArnT family glycosyltransferase n=1 Tax=Pedobacter sp. AW1-32 TaxID=3383026 RepID=UPI003FEF9660